ncbi:MAG: M56 family metallopeptidase [Lachnospiraceae bacterium]
MIEIFTLFLSLSIAGTIIALILFLLKPIIQDRFSKTWQYYIWLIVIIRLLLPYSPGDGIVGGLFSQADHYSSVQEQAGSSNDLDSDDTENTNSQLSTSLENESTKRSTGTEAIQALKDNIWIFWLVIAAILFVRKVKSYHSFVGDIKAGRKKITDPEILSIYQGISKRAGVKRPLPLYQNELISTPMLAGVIRPFIVLPDLNVSRNEASNIFQHELTHYQRLDIFYKWLVQIAVCLHWFNPIVYLIGREINKNCELACDEAIIKRMDIREKYDYGDTLLATINPDGGHSNTVISITLNEDARLLKERLDAIMNFRKKSAIISILTLILTVGIFCGVTFIGAYVGADSTINSVNDAPEYSIYQPYDLTYNAKTDKLYYNEQTVRYFVDEYAEDGVCFAYGDYEGMIDLYAVRDRENRTLTGIEAYSQEDYDLRTAMIEAEGLNTEPDYAEAYRMLIEEVPESLLLWTNQCQTSAHEGPFVTEQRGRYFVYCRTAGEYDFEITTHGDEAELTIYDINDSGTSNAIARYTGYALLSVPYYEGLS